MQKRIICVWMHFVNWMHFGARWMHVRTKSCYALYVKTIISCFVSDNKPYRRSYIISKWSAKKLLVKTQKTASSQSNGHLNIGSDIDMIWFGVKKIFLLSAYLSLFYAKLFFSFKLSVKMRTFIKWNTTSLWMLRL